MAVRGVAPALGGCPRKVLAAVLVGTHAPLLALVAHRAFASVAGRRAPVAAIALAVGATVLGSAVSVRELSHLDHEMRSLAGISSRDQLTGVCNRRAGEERLAEDLARAARDGRTISLVVLDLDGLKGTNDALGHAAGDALIKRAADALGRNLREGDWVARWGGDEFVLGLWDAADPWAAKKVLKRIAWELRKQDVSLPHSLHANADVSQLPRATFSAGVALCEPGDDPRRCLARADALLYEAKRAGRDRIVPEEPRRMIARAG